MPSLLFMRSVVVLEDELQRSRESFGHSDTGDLVHLWSIVAGEERFPSQLEQ